MPDPTEPTDQKRPVRRSSGSSRARGKLTHAERDRIRDLARRGGSVRGIAAEVGRSPATVSRVAGDLLVDRRGQTAAATTARSVDLGAERVKLMEQLLRAARGGLGRWAGVNLDDHRGSVDEARAVSALVSAYARLDDRHARAQGSQGMNDVDAWLAAMAGQPDLDLMPDYNDDDQGDEP